MKPYRCCGGGGCGRCLERQNSKDPINLIKSYRGSGGGCGGGGLAHLNENHDLLNCYLSLPWWWLLL